MNRALLARLGGVVVAAVAVASCSAVRSDVSIPASDALAPPTSAAQTTTTSPPTSTTETPLDRCEDDSFRPTEPTPQPGEMPAGSSMRDIQDRGTLRVVVDDSTLFFSSRSVDGELEGFEAELAHQLANAIFGDRDQVEFIIGGVGDAKLDPLRGRADYAADAVISVVTINCERWKDVAFSRPYYETQQGILVARNAPFKGPRIALTDLADATICVTRGSSSRSYVNKHLPDARVMAVGSRTDCLVALQEGRCEAIVLPLSILAGLHMQDATTRLLEPDPPQSQKYGIAVPNDNEDFVRFVNGLLEQWAADGTLERLQQEYMPEELHTDPVVPSSGYGD